MDWIDAFHEIKTGKNGGGDKFFTDGRLAVFTVQKGPAPLIGE